MKILSLPLLISALVTACMCVALNAHAEPAIVPTRDLASLIKPSSSTAPEPQRGNLSVLSYNIRGLPWPIAKRRKRALVDIGREFADLRRQGRAPNIVLIQEGFEDIGELVRLSGYRYWAVGPRREARAEAIPSGGFSRARYLVTGEGWGKFTSSGLHILSDFPITEVESAPFFYCAGWDCLANKGVMLARVKLPGLAQPLDIVNTHMNSLGAAKVPAARSLRAHNLQTEQLLQFIDHARRRGAPLIVGGDFNVRNAPDRYYYRGADRPFVVATEYCKGASVCELDHPLTDPEPWLDSDDLQAFALDGEVAVRPSRLGELFAGGETGALLSDHKGVLVDYRLEWGAGEGRLELAGAR